MVKACRLKTNPERSMPCAVVLPAGEYLGTLVARSLGYLLSSVAEYLNSKGR